jgi:hypothetical protein
MPTHYVVRLPSEEDKVNAAIKENEAKGAGLIQVLPIVLESSTKEVMLVFRTTEDETARPAGFRFAGT